MPLSKTISKENSKTFRFKTSLNLIIFSCWLMSFGCGGGDSGSSNGGTNSGGAGDVTNTTSTPGTAKLARSVSVSGVGNQTSTFTAITTDSAGNVFAAGHQYAAATYTYGSGVSAIGAYGGGPNSVIVKYNSSGAALWARTLTTSSFDSRFYAVVTDAAGNVYAAGYQTGTNIFTYGSGVSATGTSGGDNVTLVKYDTNGVAQWARTLTAGTASSAFNALAVDSAGNIYAAGNQNGTGTYSYRTGINATGPTVGNNIILVKYDSSGSAQWAKSLTSGGSSSIFYALAVDSSGNIYAAGYQGGTTTFTYAAGVTATATYSGANSLLVKYDSAGTALWARTVAGSNQTRYAGVAVDSSGNVFTAGYQTNTSLYTYGAGVTATGPSASATVALVKYDSTGAALWARTLTAGTGGSQFYAVTTDASGNAYVAGTHMAAGSYSYASGIDVTVPYTPSMALVKYDSSGTAEWARTVISATTATSSEFFGLTLDNSGNLYAAGLQGGTGTLTYSTGVTANGSYSGNNAVMVKYAK